MTTATVAEIISAIDAAAAAQPGGALAFDGDGTLWSGDIGEDFWDAVLKHGPHEAVREGLVRESLEAGLDAKGTSLELAHAIHAAYMAGKFSEERICEVVTWIGAGRTVAELDQFSAHTVEEIKLRDRLHGEAIRVVEHARKVGIEVFLVSASPRSIVEAAARIVGIDVANATAVCERVSAAGIVECGVIRPITYGEGKVTRLREKLGPSRTIYAAFGDNAFDVALLRSAVHPVAIRPKQRLLDRAAEVPNLRILERI